jgi:hypothetical protein
MKRIMLTRIVLVLGVIALLASSGAATAADDSRVKAATGQIESGAKKIGEGKVGGGVEQTAKGIGDTVVEGAKYTGDKLKESGKAAEPEARSTWGNMKQTASSLGATFKNFFGSLFSN